MTGVRDEGRAAVLAARLLAVAAAVLATVAVAMPLVSGLGYLDDLMRTPEVVAALSFSTVGARLVQSPQARRIGWLMLAVGVVSAAYVASASYAVLVLGADVEGQLPPGEELALLAAWVSTWAWFPPWLLVSVLLPQVLPYGQPLSPRWRVLLWTSGAVLAVGTLALATATGPVGFFPSIDNPAAVPALAAVLDPVAVAFDTLVPLLILASLVSVVVRVVRADGAERRQVGWVGYAVLVTVTVILFAPSVWNNAAVLLVPLGIGVAATRYRLYDLDLLVNRTLVAGVLLALAAVAYVALVAWVGSLVGTSTGVTPFVAAFTVALAFHPARVRVQRGVDRLFFGRRGDPLGLIRALDETLRGAESPRAALTDATAMVRSGLRLSGAAVTVTMPSGEEVRTQSGQVGARAVDIPLELHGEQVGTLHAAPRSADGPLGDTDQRVLASLAGPIASVAYALRLSGDLEESRRRLLDAQEEERRRLRRDLHDGLGPQLAGVVMSLDVVRSALARGDAERATELTDGLVDQAREAVEDVRRLASGLRPPVLDDLGLVGALRLSGPAAAPEGPTVDISSEGPLADLPAAVEVAAYRIVSEALTNAARHAGAERIDVVLRACEDALTLEVRDDGCGLPDVVAPGVGLASMQARAAELGGWCTVTPTVGGTLVTARLPGRSS